ncbi:hypothetical protein Pint_03696 [Pistacia integerrima]|uniref:Uncharacterized protein n=1 Tax=Pistacia integerrima TaxID=434235 RepID=A0ACC0Z4C3_9ROSI|nr:hypothetical protein Pint_03696 [Pistacia integerrima]
MGRNGCKTQHTFKALGEVIPSSREVIPSSKAASSSVQ